MENKDKYFNLLKENNGKLNELDLGESIGLNEDQTQEIITQLLSEHKVDYIVNGACNYSIKTRLKQKSKKLK